MGLQPHLDSRNTAFWNELCGSGLARSLGITQPTPDSLRRFDEAYMAFYPYLAPYVTDEDLREKKVLEIGLGYGTLGQFIASRGCQYYGLDIAPTPVAMMRYRLAQLGQDCEGRVQQGSALDIPHPDATFDYVYTIGCLHHTGDLPKAVAEVYRVLVPGGKAVVMLYHRHSFRRLIHAPVRGVCLRLLRSRKYASVGEAMRAVYDANLKGEAAPHTDFVSRANVRRLFARFSDIRIDTHNFDTYTLLRGRIVILPRERLLNNIARILGTDLYIVAKK
jgi:SAM-dependent methyltransferase